MLIGAQSFINATKPLVILFEFNYMHIYSSTSLTDLMTLIESDYDFFRVLPKGKLYLLNGKELWFTEIYGFQNIVCLLRIGI